MLRLQGSERVVRKPNRFVSRLHQIELIQNLLEDRDPVPVKLDLFCCLLVVHLVLLFLFVLLNFSAIMWS